MVTTATEPGTSDSKRNALRPRVFFVERVDKSIRDAERFGDIVYLFDNNDKPNVWRSEEFCDCAIERLEALSYCPHSDYIAVTGNVIALAIVLSAAGSLFGFFNVLFFDAKDSCYCKRELGAEPKE